MTHHVETRHGTSLQCHALAHSCLIFAAFFSIHQKLRPTRTRVMMMYTLNFPNGMSQTYSTSGELMNAAHKIGGTAKSIGNKTYVFVPKK